MKNPVGADEVVDAGTTSEEKAEVLETQESVTFTSEDGEVVDEETIRKFVEELEEQTRMTDRMFNRLREEMAEKQSAYQERLSQAPDCGREDLEFLLGNVFATRRHVDDIIEMTGPDQLNEAIATLIDEDVPVAQRFEDFCGTVEGADGAVIQSLAAELLHHMDPEAYSLWARWMWNPGSMTGVVPLMTMNDVELSGDSAGETYGLLIDAVGNLQEAKSDLGFNPDVVSGPHGTDVAMATLHAVYSYLVLGMRMTREFTEAIPDHPEYVRRLLGTTDIATPTGNQ